MKITYARKKKYTTLPIPYYKYCKCCSIELTEENKKSGRWVCDKCAEIKGE